jgi:hypothetical protein
LYRQALRSPEKNSENVICNGGSNNPNDPHAGPRPITSVKQRWFVGAHANVGGGYNNDLLAQIPLRWIMEKASKHGLTFRNDVDIDGDALTAPITDSYKAFFGGTYFKVHKPHFRPIGADPEVRDDGTHTSPRIRYSVNQRPSA